MKTIDLSGELIYADEDCLVHRQGGELVITQVDDLEPVFQEVAELRDGGQHNRNLNMRYLGSVPLSTLIARPELADDGELKRYLRARPRLRAVPATSF